MLIHDDDEWDVVTNTHLKVVGVMCCSNFYCAGSEFWIDKFISNDWNHSVHKWQPDFLANHVLVTRIIWVDCNCAITKHCLRASRCDRDLHIAFAICYLYELTSIILMFYFNIREGCKTTWTPVDDALGAIDKSSIIKALKDCQYRFGETFIHRESLARPINAITKSLHLSEDRSARFGLPLPHLFDECFATEIVT